MMKVITLIFFLFLSLVFAQYKPLTVPNPSINYGACNMKKASFICNPDKLLSDSTAEKLATITTNLEQKTSKILVDCSTGYQMGILAIKSVSNPKDLDKSELIKEFTKAIHDQWGVGDANCNTGVMMVFSRDDRQIYVSTGRGTKKILQDFQIDEQIEKILPHFKQQKYDEGILELAEGISQILIENKEPPGMLSRLFWFLIKNWWIMLIFLAIGFAIYSSHKENVRRQEMREKLKKLDRIKNDILNDKGDKHNNKFEMKECAICLEELDDKSEYNKTLPCDHIFHRECINTWSNNNKYCPICRKSTTKNKGEEEDQPKNDRSYVRQQQEEWLYFSTSNVFHTYSDVSYGYTVPRSSIFTTNYVQSYDNHHSVYLRNRRSESSNSSYGSSFGGGSSSGGGGSGGSW